MAGSSRRGLSFILAALLPLACGLGGAGRALPTTCNVQDYGAVGDGTTFDTAAVQNAIDSCASLGGGVVVFPAYQRFLIATIFLRSHITLRLEAGSRILASPRLEDYPAERARWYAILAEGATRVAIEGRGTIDGQGAKFVVRWSAEKNEMVSWNATGACLGDECRPRLVGFLDCADVAVTGVRLAEPAYWCLHLVRCVRTRISGVLITGNFSTPNNDGIDVDGSNETTIDQSRVDTGDDAVCAKSTAGPLRGLLVRDCSLRSKSSAVKLGSGTEHEMRDLSFRDLRVVDSHRGLGIQLRDGGSIFNVTFANIEVTTQYYHPSWWGRAEPIYITACPRGGGGGATAAAARSAGSIDGVTFVNISARSENGILVAGAPRGGGGGAVRNVALVNVSLYLDRWTAHEGGRQDFRPGCQGLVPHATNAIFLANVHDVLLQGLNVTWGSHRRPDWGLTLDSVPFSVSRLRMDGVEFAAMPAVAEDSSLSL